MKLSWGSVFDHYGVKRVTKTDKRKAAYVPNKGQRQAIEAAGVRPAASRPAPSFGILVLWDARRRNVKSSYYHSARSQAAKRAPEPRMGHTIISGWLQEGDCVVIGNIASKVFAFKLPNAPAVDDDAALGVAARLNKRILFERARQAPARPRRRTFERDEFVRNPYVSAAALSRSKNKCEMPGCRARLFARDDGTNYLEVHHVVPLSENGDARLANVAALCPSCHRQLHFGRDRTARRSRLAAHILTLKLP